MKRRDFINWVGLGWIASSLPVAIAACSPQSNETTSSASENWVKVGNVADLDKNGQLVAKNSPIGNVLVVGTSQAANLIAVEPVCTHQGCIVDWKPDTQKFACPCHQAEYAADGTVQRGPTKKSLKTYTAKIEGDAVLVKS